MGAQLRLGQTLLTAALLAGSLAATTAPAAVAGTTCRVRNVTQDTHGRSLIRMAARAQDGDKLRVRGTCPGTVVIFADILVTGMGEGATLTGEWERRVVQVKGHATVTLRNLAIVRGRSGDGGGILNSGTLTLTDSTVRGNKGRDHAGGIANGGTLTLTGSTVSGNTARGEGGGISNWYLGTLTLTGSTVRGNTARWGGGIRSRGTLTLAGSTVRDNVAKESGGGIENVGDALTLSDSTVSGNTAGTQGGGIWNQDHLSLIGSIVSGNTAGAQGGGIWNFQRPPYQSGTVTLDGASSVSGNTPDDCVGTPAC